MFKVYCDSSTKEACYVVEGEDPVVTPYAEPVTNNVGEYISVLIALRELLEREAVAPIVLTDSQLVVNQVAGQDKHGHLWRKCKPHLQPYRDATRKAVFALAADLQWIPREENMAGKVLE